MPPEELERDIFADRLLPAEGEVAARDDADPDRRARRRGADGLRRAAPAAGRRAQDGERRHRPSAATRRASSSTRTCGGCRSGSASRRQEDPVKIERDLMKLVPREDWARFPHLLIWHGRRVCDARRPRVRATASLDRPLPVEPGRRRALRVGRQRDEQPAVVVVGGEEVGDDLLLQPGVRASSTAACRAGGRPIRARSRSAGASERPRPRRPRGPSGPPPRTRSARRRRCRSRGCAPSWSQTTNPVAWAG